LHEGGNVRLKVWRVIGVCLLAMAIGAAAAYAQDGTTTGTGTSTDVTTTAPTTATTPPPPPPDPPKIADGVTVAGVAVGGMTAEEAAAALTDFWRRPFVLTLGSRVWTPSAARLGGSTDISAAVTQALAAAPLGSLTLPVNVNRDALRLYVSRRARETYRPAVNSTVRLKSLRPFVSKGRPGRRVMQGETRTLVRAALKAHGRGPITLPTEVVKQTVTRRNFGPVVVVRRDSHRLYLYNVMTFRASFGVATGMAAYPTPIGHFRIVSKVRWPWWYPPSASWAAGASPVPPGINNPLGTRWMGLSVGGVGIHGTPSAYSIGYSASHGCIRMRIPEAEWLFERVRVGTHVFIVRA
jgi:lipoprotein-anchoring transpeptidase ErfK/SrfK